jgi:hypothetical protein
MRAHEFTNLNEAEADTPNAEEIFHRLRQAGYSPLGDGQESEVWSRDEGTVIKILMPAYSDDPFDKRKRAMDMAEKSFKVFYNFCQAHTNLPCLPKFKEIGGVHHALFKLGRNYYRQIAMEKLKKIPNGSFQEYMVWLLGDSASTKCSWSDMTELMIEPPDEWGGRDFSTNVNAMLRDKYQSAMYAQLFACLQELYGEAIHNNIGFDLHTENCMMRSNGDLVITDPFYGKRYGN